MRRAPKDSPGGPVDGGLSDRLKKIALLLVFVLSLAFQLRVLDEKFLLGDEGIALMGGWRISQGEVPHRDFFEIVPPVSFLPTAAVFKLFGPGILQARLLVLAYSLLLLFLVDRILFHLSISTLGRAFALLFLTPFGVFYWPVPSHHWVADLFLLGAILALLRSTESADARPSARPSSWWAALSGACAALCGLSLQDQGAYFVLAVALFVLPCLPSLNGMRKRVATAWTGGLLAVSGAAACVLLPLVGASQLFYQWVLFPATRYKNIQTNATGLFAGWDRMAGLFSWTAFSSRPLFVLGLVTCTLFLFLLLPLAVISSIWLLRSSQRSKPVSRLVIAGAAACAAAAAHRWSLTNVIWASPGLFLPVLCALGSRESDLSPWVRKGAQIVLWTGVAAAAALTATYYQTASIVPMSHLQAPAGTLRSVRTVETRQAQEVVDALVNLPPPGVPVFCNGYTPLLNFMTLRKNPTRYQFFQHPVYHTDEQAREVVAALQGQPEAWILLTKPVEPKLLLESFVVSAYDAVWQNDRAVLFRPRTMPSYQVVIKSP